MPSVEKVRLVSSGTEAAMTAVRLARGATGRVKIVKFAGCYHGHVDALLVAGGQRRRDARACPDRRASPPGTVADTIVVPYNDLAALDAAFAEHGAELAAVLVEPIAANMGLVPPADGFLARLCATAAPRHGALLVFDEVITGFRVGLGGAQGRFGITPDLSIFGKVVGGGLPLAAVGGRADADGRARAARARVPSGHAVGEPARHRRGARGARAARRRRRTRRSKQRRRGSPTACAARSPTPASPRRSRARSRSSACSSPTTPVHDYDEAQAADHARYARFFHGLLDRGVYFAPSGYETLFPSLAHTDADIDETHRSRRRRRS